MATANPYWKNGVIYIAVRNRNKRSITSTGFKVARKYWNANSNEVRKTHGDCRTINETLQEKTQQAETIITEMIADGIDPDPAQVIARMERRPQQADKTFTAYAEECLAEYKKKGQIATWKAYRSGVSHFKVFAGNVPFSEVTPALMRRFQTYLQTEAGRGEQKGLKPNTVHKYVSALKTIYRQAQDEGLASYGERPFKTVKLKKEKVIKEKLTTAEVRKVATLEIESKTDQLIRDAWMFAFYAGGMRFGDVAFFKRRHLKDDGGEVRSLYRMGKTEGIHGVLLVDEAVRILDRYGWREKRPNQLVFPLLEGYDLSDAMKRHNAKLARNAYANKRLKKIAEWAGVTKNLTFHLSRHSIAGYLLEEGYDVYTIKEILGHETVRITEDYLRGFKGRGPDDAMRSIGL